MQELRTDIEINAPAERVWQVLTDFPSLPEWNPFMRSAEGNIAEGPRLKIRLQPPGGMGMTIKLTVLKAEPNRELRWRGHLLMSGLFDGEHFFTIESVGEGRVRFVQGEDFRGVLVPLMWPMLRKSTRRGFEEMNQALKARAEQGA